MKMKKEKKIKKEDKRERKRKTLSCSKAGYEEMFYRGNYLGQNCVSSFYGSASLFNLFSSRVSFHTVPNSIVPRFVLGFLRDFEYMCFSELRKKRMYLRSKGNLYLLFFDFVRLPCYASYNCTLDW